MFRTVALLLALVLPLEAAAECYADYKAKRDDPLRLHYGVIELPDRACADRQAAADEIARRIAGGNWQLLSVEGIFDRAGAEQRRGSAGDFFLRY